MAHFLQEYWIENSRQLLEPGQTVFLAGMKKEDGLVCTAIREDDLAQSVPALACSHEEADTRLLFHAKHAFNNGYETVIIHSPDTDVAVLCVANAAQFTGTLYFATGVNNNFRYIDMTKLSADIGQLANILPGLHALTGADATSGFAGIGKKTAVSMASSCIDLIQNLGESFSCTDETLLSAEKFIVSLYKKTRCEDTSINCLRYSLFCKTQKRNTYLPPCQDTLQQHIRRANYQAAIWALCLDGCPDIPPPFQHGWNEDYEPVLMTQAAAPAVLQELTVCNCKSGCLKVCGCRKVDLACTPACGCSSDCNNVDETYDNSDYDE